MLERPAIVLLAISTHDPHPGRAPDNVVNRLATLGGLQIEQSLALRSTRDAPEVVAEVVAEVMSHQLAAHAAPTRAEGPTGESPGWTAGLRRRVTGSAARRPGVPGIDCSASAVPLWRRHNRTGAEMRFPWMSSTCCYKV